MDTREWTITATSVEAGGHTYAEAAARSPGSPAWVGVGWAARRGDADPARVAVARALADLGQRLFMAATAELGPAVTRSRSLDSASGGRHEHPA